MSNVDRISPSATTGHVLHWAARYDLMAWLLMFGRERAFREKLVRLAHVQPGDSVLDIGCGTGTLAIAAARQVGPTGRVHGIDASPEMITRAKKKSGKAGVEVEFQTGIVEALPYSTSSFDVVLSTLMLHHLPRKAREACAREIRRVLKPGGQLLAVDFGATPSGKKSFLGHFHRHGHLDLRDIVELLNGAGLSIVESGAVGFRNLYFALAASPSHVSGTSALTGSAP